MTVTEQLMAYTAIPVTHHNGLSYPPLEIVKTLLHAVVSRTQPLAATVSLLQAQHPDRYRTTASPFGAPLNP
jgi:hypothetical protein